MLALAGTYKPLSNRCPLPPSGLVPSAVRLAAYRPVCISITEYRPWLTPV